MYSPPGNDAFQNLVGIELEEESGFFSAPCPRALMHRRVVARRARMVFFMIVSPIKFIFNYAVRRPICQSYHLNERDSSPGT